MKFASNQSREEFASSSNDALCRENIFHALQQCRSLTLNLIENIDSSTFFPQAHDDFSPIGWHLGHIAFIEAYWILEHCAGFSPVFPEYQQLFAADGLPKRERQNLPSPETIQAYLDTVRSKVLNYLTVAPLEKQERLWYWLIQHESQHNETIAFILQLHHWQNKETGAREIGKIGKGEMVRIPAGEFAMGSNKIDAQDNERLSHKIYLDTYWLDRFLVTCQQYSQFIEADGYSNPQWWSKAGWQWLQNEPVSQPLYWSDFYAQSDRPVCGVSYYEAEAYANFIGKRLPTEAEWEKAASWDAANNKKLTYPWGEAVPNFQLCNYSVNVGQTTPVDSYPLGQSPYGCYDLLGNVWEWTASWFAGYSGFVSYPYVGYSQAYFDNQHKVLRGGSWATRQWGLRNSFRNWYHPWIRQILAGFRCAKTEGVYPLP